MSRIKSVLVLTLFVVLAGAQSNSTEQSCTFCQTTACHCPRQQSMLNCSHYLLELPFIADCVDRLVWETVDFSSRNLGVLDASKLVSLRVKRWLLTSSFITDIREQTFDATGDILIELNLAMNQLTNVSSRWLNSKLVQLERLNLASNQLESFADLDGVRLPRLRALNLSRNQIDTFPSHIYRWTALQTLDLSFNRLTSVPRLALVGLNNLTWLSLASNRDLDCK